MLEIIAFVSHPSYDYTGIAPIFFQCDFKCKSVTSGCTRALQERKMPLGAVGGQGRSTCYFFDQDTIFSAPGIIGCPRRAFGCFEGTKLGAHHLFSSSGEIFFSVVVRREVLALIW